MREGTRSRIRDEVAALARALDTHVSEWQANITEPIGMQVWNGRTCPLGQVYGHFANAPRQLRKMHGVGYLPPKHVRWAEECWAREVEQRRAKVTFPAEWAIALSGHRSPGRIRR